LDTLPEKYNGTAEVVLCHGNSLIYATSWGTSEIDSVDALEGIQTALHNFYALLQPGCFLYVDIMHSSEKPGGSTKGPLVVDGIEYFLDWDVSHDFENRVRTMELTYREAGDKGSTHVLKSTLLLQPELCRLLHNAGFSRLEEIALKTENDYSVILAHKD
jgi:hypothetical protein